MLHNLLFKYYSVHPENIVFNLQLKIAGQDIIALKTRHLWKLSVQPDYTSHQLVNKLVRGALMVLFAKNNN